MENLDFTHGAKTIEFQQEMFDDKTIKEFNYNFQRMEIFDIKGSIYKPLQ